MLFFIYFIYLLNYLLHTIFLFIYLQIADLFQITIAVNKAIRLNLLNKMKTKNVFTEIIYNLSPDRKVSDVLVTLLPLNLLTNDLTEIFPQGKVEED